MLLCDADERNVRQARRASVIDRVADVDQLRARHCLLDREEPVWRGFRVLHMVGTHTRLERDSWREAVQRQCRLKVQAPREYRQPVLRGKAFQQAILNQPLLAQNQPVMIFAKEDLVEAFDDGRVLYVNATVTQDALRQEPIVVVAALVLVILNLAERHAGRCGAFKMRYRFDHGLPVGPFRVNQYAVHIEHYGSWLI